MSHATTTVDRPRGDVLIGAAAAAGFAPSILNTQPWRWRLEPGRLQLFAERSRQLTVTDPQGRQLMISCGAALHHARTALAAAGWTAHVTRLPDTRQPDLLATLTVADPIAATEVAGRLARAIPARHTDRRPVSDQPLPAASVDAIAAAARAHSRLHIFTPDQALALASAAGRAAAVQADDPRVRAELAHWTGTAAPPGAGLPAEVLPEHPAQTTVPGRDFGRGGTLPIGTGHDKTAVYALLFGDADEPANWLRTGEALSAAWLTATTLGVSVVPLSHVIEVLPARLTLRRLINGLGSPHLVLRLGVADPEHPGYVHTPRLAATPTTDSSAE
ncbi:nitroreductase [Dactylosporangium sp. NPDC049140]|uniref:Acg family FMN-binding oxidoreductase n=1 Tax=Dactylosporangium sp. NPDC049140 TaxID=3155647 RepID=UPI0034094ED8